MKLTLTGTPLSTNNVYKIRCGGKFPRMYMSAKGKEKKESYRTELKEQFKKEPLTGDLVVNVLLYFGDKRVHDWDNYHKLSMDACSGIIWEDDVQIQEAHVFKEYDKENPRIELYVL